MIVNIQQLSPRQRMVAKLVCSGLKNQEIADGMGITMGATKALLGEVLRKLKVADRYALVSTLLLPLDSPLHPMRATIL